MSSTLDKYSSSSNEEDKNVNALSQTELEKFVITEQQEGALEDIDPDNNYFHHINNECSY